MDAPPTEPLPVDVLLEIVARSDITTAIRCAATGSLLRDAILDPGFRDRLAESTSSSRGHFDPARLLGVSYSSHDYGGAEAIHLRPPRRLQLDTDLLLRWPFQPVSSRDGLLVLWSSAAPGAELRVANAVTGHVTRLPRSDVLDGHELYRPALLAVDAARGSFDLLAMDERLRARVFSSRDAAWGAKRTVAPPPGRGGCGQIKQHKLHGSPAVVGRTAHWLCYSWPEGRDLRGDGDPFVLAVRADSSSSLAESIELPEGCLGAESCGLAATADGLLGFVAAERDAVVTWALSPSAPEEEGSWSWSRQVVVDRRRIAEQVAPGVKERRLSAIAIQGFGERSGTVLLRMDMVGLVHLNLETGEAILLRACSRRDTRALQLPQAWLHEVDLASLLLDMEIF